jgi:ATP-binding cassette, subfamily B, bacterial PglK
MLKEIIYKLRVLLTRKDKKSALLLTLFSVVMPLIEAAGISAIMPFIAVASDFSLIHSKEYFSIVYKFFSFESDAQFVIAFGFVLIFFYLFRGVLNLFYYHVLSRFSQTKYHQISYRLFENYMDLPYEEFISRNSSTMTKSLVTETLNLSSIIFNMLFMLSEIFVVIFIYAAMLYVDYKITFALTIILVLNALLMTKTISSRIKQAGIIREATVKKFYEIINRSFGNFKLTKLYSNDKEILENFKGASYTNAKANITNQTLNQIPRLFLESAAFSIIISIVIYFIWTYEGDISTLLGLVSMFVLALYRLMPSVSRIMSSYNSILFAHRALDIIYSDMTHSVENLGNQEILFNDGIDIKNLSFKYEENKPIFKDVNLTIKKGSSVAFVGGSGSGKSTLVDILMGLHKVKKGKILIDGNAIDDSNIKSWRNKVGYIPQSVYLFDGTAGQNVAFGSEYDEKKVDDVLKKAKIYDFLDTKNGRDTKVGEGGVRLSGGQKQRIAIARALYTDPEVLVLDEATSALDEGIERQIMSEIYDISNNKTLIIIAHRVSTLYRCEKIYRIRDGMVFDES